MNIRQVVDFFVQNSDDINKLLINAVQDEYDPEIIKYIIKNHELDLNSKLFNELVFYGHIDIIKLMLKQEGIYDLDQAMCFAAENGHIEIVKLMIKHGANDFNEAMYKAAENGHIDIVKLMIQYGANNFTEAMAGATLNGHTKVVDYLLSRKVDPKDIILTKKQKIELNAIKSSLRNVMKKEFIDTWMKTPNKAFDGLSPLEIFVLGEETRLRQAVYLLESGQPG